MCIRDRTLTACEKPVGVSLTISLSPEAIQLKVGEKYQLTATCTPEGLESRIVDVYKRQARADALYLTIIEWRIAERSAQYVVASFVGIEDVAGALS